MNKQMMMSAGMATNEKMVQTMNLLSKVLSDGARIRGYVTTWLQTYYGNVLGRPIDGRQLWALLWAQLTFFAGVVAGECSLLVRIALLALTVQAVLRCRRLLKTK